MDLHIRNGGNIDAVEDKIVLAVGNGYQVAAILADIITTPLFRFKEDESGKPETDEHGAPKLETDEQGLQVLNQQNIDSVLETAQDQAQKYQ